MWTTAAAAAATAATTTTENTDEGWKKIKISTTPNKS